MEKAAIGTNDLGMHIVIRPISKDLLLKDETVGMETEKINSLFAELLYRIVYRDSLRIGICRNCGAPFLQSGIGSLNDVCSQACRMAQRRRKGLA